jgi:hypothetical protein
MTKRGRPQKYDAVEMAKKANQYAVDSKLPIVAEFAHEQGITRVYLYELAQRNPKSGLSDAIKNITEHKEIVLEKGALLNKLNPTMAIFSLKQLGWKDKPDETGDSDTLKKAKEILGGVTSAI